MRTTTRKTRDIWSLRMLLRNLVMVGSPDGSAVDPNRTQITHPLVPEQVPNHGPPRISPSLVASTV